MEKRRLIIVEDEMLAALYLKALLEKNGYEIVCVVNTGREAIDSCLTFIPDLVLMDIYLKDRLDGIEVVEELKKTVDIPVIYITANSEQSTTQRAVKTNPVCIISKPYSDNTLLLKISGCFQC
jgi:CheY-like chemotaxis protein